MNLRDQCVDLAEGSTEHPSISVINTKTTLHTLIMMIFVIGSPASAENKDVWGDWNEPAVEVGDLLSREPSLNGLSGFGVGIAGEAQRMLNQLDKSNLGDQTSALQKRGEQLNSIIRSQLGKDDTMELLPKGVE